MRSNGRSVVRKAEPHEVEAFFNVRMSHYACEYEGEIISIGTLSRVSGRLWAFFSVQDGLSPRQARAVLYALMRGLRRIQEPVLITTNEAHGQAVRLVRSLGFVATGEAINGQNVWVLKPRTCRGTVTQMEAA